MEATQNAEVIELSLEKTIETKLVQSNVTEQVLLALKKQYGGMKLKAIDDKESYLEIKAAARECAKVRTLTVKLCKEGRERAVREQKLWIAKEKEIVGRVAEVEDELDAEIKRFDDEVARIEQEEKNRQEDAYINRQAALTKMGAVYSDGCFTLGEASFEANLIKGSSEDVWQDAVLPKFQSEYEKIEAIRIAEEKRKAEEAAELKRKQDELAEQQRVFEEQQKEFMRKQLEAEQAERERLRQEELEKEKAKSALQKQRFEQMFPVNPTGADVDMNTLWALSESDFAEKLAKKTVEFNKIQAEKARIAEEKMLADIEAAKQQAIIEEQKRQAAAAEEKRKEEERKQAELEAATDRVRWDEFIKQVKDLPSFEFKSGRFRGKMKQAAEKIEQIIQL